MVPLDGLVAKFNHEHIEDTQIGEVQAVGSLTTHLA